MNLTLHLGNTGKKRPSILDSIHTLSEMHFSFEISISGRYQKVAPQVAQWCLPSLDHKQPLMEVYTDQGLSALLTGCIE